MDFLQYVRLFRKWLWLVVLAAFVSGGISFILNTGRPLTYRAEALLNIGSYLNVTNPDYAVVVLGRELAQSYVELVKTNSILQRAIDDATVAGMTPNLLKNLIDATIIEGTSFMRLSVEWVDPVVAANLANALAAQLVAQAPGALTESDIANIEFMNDQIETLERQQESATEQLSALEIEIDRTTNVEARNTLQERRVTIIGQINTSSATIQAYQGRIIDLQQRVNSIGVLEDAAVPTNASGVNVLNITMIGALVGAAIAAGIAFLVEYLDDTVRTSEEAVQSLALPVLGAIMRIGKKTDKYAERLVTHFPSMSPIAEGYRTLRTNLLFTSNLEEKGLYIVTSANPEEGKSITTANLAITMALAGLQVLLIDADLRRPKMHEVFGLENNVGLTTLLFADPGKAEDSDDGSDDSKMPSNLKQCLQNTSVPRLRVITSGFIPSNPTEILGSALMKRWIDAFRASPNIDIVLIDTPPCLMVADSTVLAATSKADVVLVIDCAHTRRGAALKAKEKFAQLGIGIKGVVLNRINPRDESYDYGQGYTYYYTPYAPTQKQAATSNSDAQKLAQKIAAEKRNQ